MGNLKIGVRSVLGGNLVEDLVWAERLDADEDRFGGVQRYILQLKSCVYHPPRAWMFVVAETGASLEAVEISQWAMNSPAPT